MAEALLSIGSNIGDSPALLRGVRDAFGNQVLGASSLYRTPPWGVVDQPDFYNAALLISFKGSPEQLLQRCQDLEAQAHRVREQRWGPRTLDVDMIQVHVDGAEVRQEDPHLILPHPRAHLRAFVLLPWLEIQPDATLAEQPIAKLLKQVDGAGIERVEPL
ncbi:2-amino-4-hydroxy-6-hydroxymethyldihydropteridine diphosphokinase [Corynebacterium pseudopelargi]|uniref:2-amino-4-hydroxy-6-hydroxymethyldihydropteridine diphosphokinase n=1 Tax=Corynebacterium pseudopelargi TaxID=2080757 RepID=A0A3G6IS68_9CORY|nr:2-amino-4-hydroxy-6-hydroxymethyldihydropteridine diphosphokinase [Corynebacterium pseudopelargi]AZA08451.1 2-amino-4-hydroxy-6-hydroxymethyldihydropteridine pyrophosphokinase [Corynebacterium pseudopelargi]